jgi:hypothetical protein
MNEEGEAFKEAILERVLNEGYFVQFVTDDQATVLQMGQPFAYTVGRSMFARPEFLITGLPRDIAEPVLHGLVAQDSDGNNPSAATLDGTCWTVDLDSLRLPLKLMHATPAPLLGAMVTFGWRGVEALQALWPNSAGGYPSLNDRWDIQPIYPQGRTPLIERDPYA